MHFVYKGVNARNSWHIMPVMCNRLHAARTCRAFGTNAAPWNPDRPWAIRRAASPCGRKFSLGMPTLGFQPFHRVPDGSPSAPEAPFYRHRPFRHGGTPGRRFPKHPGNQPGWITTGPGDVPHEARQKKPSASTGLPRKTRMKGRDRFPRVRHEWDMPTCSRNAQTATSRSREKPI